MKNKIILSALLCTLIVTGCVSNSSSISSSSSSESSVSSLDTSTSSSSSSVNTSSEDSSSSSISSVSGNKYEDKYYQIPEGTENFTFGISYSGALIDYAVDKIIITGVEDTFSFSFVDIFSATSTAYSSNEEVMKLEKLSETSYKVIALHEGNTVITIYDENGLDRYSQIVSVRDPMTKERMEDYLSEVEYWQSIAGFGDSYRLTFFFDNEVGVEGSLQNVPFESYTGKFKFLEETIDEYRYVFTDDNSKESEAKLTQFNVSKAGDYMYLFFSAGLAAILQPNTAIK